MPSGGALTLAARRVSTRGGTRRIVEVVVEDTGSGIPEADLPRVFEPFYTTRTKGTGLGLAICKQIVEAHGGALRVARTGPDGTTIVVTLPAEGSAHV
jgi:signal transduction histidine kinase